MPCKREMASLWRYIRHPSHSRLRRILKSRYFWHDTFGMYWARVWTCRHVHKYVLNVADPPQKDGEEIWHCFDCERKIVKPMWYCLVYRMGNKQGQMMFKYADEMQHFEEAERQLRIEELKIAKLTDRSIPECCNNCYELDRYVEEGYVIDEWSECKLCVWFPYKKQSCKRQRPKNVRQV